MPHSRSGKEVRVGAVVVAPYPGCDKDSFPKIIGVVENVNATSTTCNGLLSGVLKIPSLGCVVPYIGGSMAFTCADCEVIV